MGFYRSCEQIIMNYKLVLNITIGMLNYHKIEEIPEMEHLVV